MCFIEVIKKNIKREMLICHLWVTLVELHMTVTAGGGGKKPYEVLNAGYQFKHSF